MIFTTFNDMLRRAAWRLPDHPFIYWSDRKRSITYAQGESLSTRAAGALAALGVRKGERVGLFAHNGLDYVVAMFGIWKLGAISAHISVLQKDNLAYFIQDSSPKVLIYTGDMHEVVKKIRDQNLGVAHFICFDGAKDFASGWGESLEAAPAAPDVKVSDMDAAHLSYTSGSSGPPKGALLAHGYTARATHTIAERLNLCSADVSLGVTSLSSSFHLVANLLPGVHRAMSIGVRKEWQPQEAWQEMDERGVTFFAGNPLVLGDLLKESRAMGKAPGALTRCISGGAPLPPDVKLAYYKEFGVHIVESYGQSELGGFVALGYPRYEEGKRFYAIGPGLPDRETIVADENGQEVPVGEPGELLIRNNVMVGYWNMPEKTTSVIHDGWLHTGDMGVMDEEGYFTSARSLVGTHGHQRQGGLPALHGRSAAAAPGGALRRRHRQAGRRIRSDRVGHRGTVPGTGSQPGRTAFALPGHSWRCGQPERGADHRKDAHDPHRQDRQTGPYQAVRGVRAKFLNGNQNSRTDHPRVIFLYEGHSKGTS